MNLDRVVQILKKVNALVENLDEQGQTSAIEKDLLKRYLRDLYEQVSEMEQETVYVAQQVPETTNHEPKQPVQEVTPEVSEQPVVEPEPLKEPVFSADKQTTYYDAESKELPAETEVPEVSVETPAEPEATKYFPPEPTVSHNAEAEMPAFQASQPATETVAMTADNKFAEIFSETRATDLAGQFKLQPIQSIESAMGINQRLQTINELFDGDHNAFVETLKQVNAASDFNTAKNALVHGPAETFHWDSDLKVKLASDFVDLVRRKFV